MVMLDAARRAVGVPAQARWLLGLGIVAMLAANVVHGLTGAAVGAWPAAAFVGSYELLMMIRRAQAPEVVPPHADVSMIDPLRERAAAVLEAEFAANLVPSTRGIRTALHLGQPRTRRLRKYLATVAGMSGESPPYKGIGELAQCQEGAGDGTGTVAVRPEDHCDHGGGRRPWLGSWTDRCRRGLVGSGRARWLVRVSDDHPRRMAERRRCGPVTAEPLVQRRRVADVHYLK